MSKVSLETKGFRHTNAFQQVQNIFPTVHSSPANLALNCKAFAMIRSDCSCLFKSVNNPGGSFTWIGFPFLHSNFSGVDTDNPTFAYAMVVKNFGNSASNFYRI